MGTLSRLKMSDPHKGPVRGCREFASRIDRGQCARMAVEKELLHFPGHRVAPTLPRMKELRGWCCELLPSTSMIVLDE